MTKWHTVPHTVAVIAAAVVCALLPAPAHASPGSAPAPSMTQIDPAVLHLMQADGLPQAEAQRRISAQEKQNADAQRLAEELGPHRTAGAYLERETGELVVTVLDETAAETVRAAGARARLVAHSTAQLNAIAAEIAAAHAKELESYFVDPMLNAVVLRSSTIGTALQRYGTAVRVTAPVGRARPIQDVHAGFSQTTSPVPGGLMGCTAGFSARDVFGISQYMITAAHCVGSSLQVSVDGTAFGAAVLVDQQHDAAAVTNAFPAFWKLYPRIWAYQAGFRTVTGAPQGFLLIGTVVCKMGRTTGNTCGRVWANNVGTTDPPATGQVETDACAEPGDSGGPFVTPATVITKVVAAGTTTAAVYYDINGNVWNGPAQGTPFCGSRVGQPTSTFYTPIAQTLSSFGLVLMTG